jgi:hypothetical protein
MIALVRRIVHTVKSLLLIVVGAVFIARLVGSLLWIGCSLPLVRRMAVWRFYRRLKRSGLESSAVDALTEEYEDGLRLFGRRPFRGTP